MTITQTGFGLGLRTPHYSDFLAAKQPLDWLEVITDNYLVEGGKPLVVLDTLRRDYPVAMHGVAMSIGAPGGVDLGYLRRVKALADRIEPLWVSDHLCWTGTGPRQLHDLYPLPYTEEAARHVITQIRRAQDVLQRRLVLENVSSYIDFKQSCASEWQFLAHVANEADCLLLVDVNNVYVSSVNHGFDPLRYLRALPAGRVQQIHLAGHSDLGDHIIDTHDHPVAPAVWDLYGQACYLFGPVAAMIERDANIPGLPTLLDELAIARAIASTCAAAGVAREEPSPTAQVTWPEPDDRAGAPTLQQVQQILSHYILSPRNMDAGATALASPSEPAPPPDATALVRVREGADSAQHLGIYHHAYRARLIEVLADSFAKTYLFMGSDSFDRDATAYAQAHPPTQRSLNRYGADFPNYLASLYPGNPELRELAQLDWDLRTCFDGPDTPALNAERAGCDTRGEWLARGTPLHPSLRLRHVHTNVVKLWQAIDADEEVPPTVRHDHATSLVVWRKRLQPHFQTLEPDQALFVRHLADGASINSACAELIDTDVLPDPQRLGLWLRNWLQEGWLVGAEP
jgi:uncharacterized protein (UPF0276 family)